MSVMVNLLYTFLILRCRFCTSDASVFRVLLIINPLLTTDCSKHQQTRKTTHYALDNAVTRPIRAINGRVLCLLTTMLVSTHGISYRQNRKTCDSILSETATLRQPASFLPWTYINILLDAVLANPVNAISCKHR